MEPLINRVTTSDIEVFNLEELVSLDELDVFDISEFLDRGIILREKLFRQHAKEFDWTKYADKHVALLSPQDAIIPSWAFMLVASKLSEVARSSVHGDRSQLIQTRFRDEINAFDWNIYSNKIVVVKGCGAGHVPEDAYAYATIKLKGVAKKIMFGEPCSSVPIWRKPAAGKSDSAKPLATKPTLRTS